MELAERTEESADDITAAEIAPSPRKVTQDGHKYCKTIGKICFLWISSFIVMFFSTINIVSFQSTKK